MSAAMALSSDPVVKVCSCGRKFTASEWRELPFRGIQPLGGGHRLEYRDCPCRSTMAIDMPKLSMREQRDELVAALEFILIEGHYQTCPGRPSLGGSECSKRCKRVHAALGVVS